MALATAPYSLRLRWEVEEPERSLHWAVRCWVEVDGAARSENERAHLRVVDSDRGRAGRCSPRPAPPGRR
jgi:hypothetical protein